ncbi:MAG: GNAT family N-acetyltransferase [Nitrososphaerota archaeon]|jgi:GNAT superfamily N-acetyltransferase|nr:GNAT family N-acetyltransferase [Nitrososphaerota archaeon]MDG6948713.1 GNAT family N-acetyltransferase [Nitrososphaerota archaeon]
MATTLMRNMTSEFGRQVDDTGLVLIPWNGLATLRTEEGVEVGYFTYDYPGEHSVDVGTLPKGIVYIRYSTIHEKYRGRGYALAALTTLEADFVRDGIHTVWSLPLTTRIGFVKRCGFTRHHKTPAYAYGTNVDTHIWAKQLGPNNQ